MIALSFETQINEELARNAFSQIVHSLVADWLVLPFASRKSGSEIARIKAAASTIQNDSEYLVCVGIGGSYLGHRALIEALLGATAEKNSKTKVIYAGNALSARALEAVLAQIEGHDFSVNVISKSGTTIEPARAFAVLKQKLIEKYGEAEAKRRIYATTDARKGELHDEAEREGYNTFVVPDGVGGRYSVLSAVSLLPLAVAGIDIDTLLDGAASFAKESFKSLALDNDEESAVLGSDNREGTQFQPPNPTSHNYAYSPAGSAPELASGAERPSDWRRDLQFKDPAKNPAVSYAFFRYNLFKKGYDTEVFASFEPDLMYFHEWLKQLFGESEGKNRQGIFPASVIYSTDLHSLGQFMQEGRRNLFETVLNFPTDELNAKLVKAVLKAHLAGGIPVIEIRPSSYDAYGFGELVYFFELSCALSATLSGVNPFDQPGVEAYKNELKRLMKGDVA